jgi:hypothetical protein
MLTMSSQEKKVVPTMNLTCNLCAIPVTVGRQRVKTAGGAGDAGRTCQATTARGMGRQNHMSFRSVPVAWSNTRVREIQTGGVKTAICNRQGYKPRNSGRGGAFRVIQGGG